MIIVVILYADKNQYVHRRDSVSLSTLSDREIQQRINLGLVTAPAHDPRLYYEQDSDEEEEEGHEEEWEDFVSDADEDDHLDGSKSSKHHADEDYRLSTSRRSSVDLSTMTSNYHDPNDYEDGDSDSNKRHRARASIRNSVSTFDRIEETEDEEVATVNGEDDDA